jgi:asparagine N-glycosylation enzyme membrane subunit Stt3
MPSPPEATPERPDRYTGRGSGYGAVLALTFLCVLAAVLSSTALLIYTALHQDIKDGLFALAFAILSARAALSWFRWRESDRRDHERRKSGDEPIR